MNGGKSGKELVKENKLTLKSTLWNKKENFMKFSVGLKNYKSGADIKIDKLG
jgi:hypothetical protein